MWDTQKTGLNHFRAISTYVRSTHVLLAIGTIVAPAIFFAVESPPILTGASMLLAALCISFGASLLVAAEFNPYHRLTRWLYSPKMRELMRFWVVLMALIVIVVVPATSSFTTAAVIPLAWALTAACYGMFWDGITRLFLATIGIGVASWIIATVRSDQWEPLTLLIATLLALGVLGQDSIYILALELDDLRTREAERAVITERQRFASDLHDIQGQHLSLITVEAELVSRLIDRAEYSAAVYHANRVQTIALEALEEMHRVVYANREVYLDDEIIKAIRVLQSAGISINQDTKDIPEFSKDVDRLLGLTVREGVTNILKHTQAQTCSISVQRERRSGQDGISLIVADSGVSDISMTVSANTESGTGLKMLNRRYRKLGGTLEFVQNGDGGQLTGWIPSPKEI